MLVNFNHSEGERPHDNLGEKKMNYWTNENTDGFSENEIAILNLAQETLERENPEVDPKNIADHINNAFAPNITAQEIVNSWGG